MASIVQNIVCWLLMCLCLAHPQELNLFEGDPCNFPSGEVGLCTKVSSCPVVSANLKKGVLPIICCFQGLNQLVVCCPEVGSTALPPIDPYAKVKSMCERYAAYAAIPKDVRRPDVNSTQDGPSTHAAQQLHGSKTKAGGSPTDRRKEVGIRIFGGEVAAPDEFPHMAALGFGDEANIQWMCGGSLISERFVLTAAHCLQAQGIGLVRWVRLGAITASETDERAQKVAVKAIHRHKDYSLQSYYHDIALLELGHDVVQLDSSVYPACLHTVHVGPEDGDCIATGWGAISSGIAESLELMKVELPFQELEICNTTYRPMIRTRRLSEGVLEDSMICVGDLESHKDTCQGDSGGPIQVLLASPPNMYSIVGVTSFGVSGCGQSLSPAIYTRVSHYIPWITNIVWPET